MLTLKITHLLVVSLIFQPLSARVYVNLPEGTRPNDLILDEIPMLHRHEDMLEQEELTVKERQTQIAELSATQAPQNHGMLQGAPRKAEFVSRWGPSGH